jgi:hypothetical protein
VNNHHIYKAAGNAPKQLGLILQILGLILQKGKNGR